MAGFNAEFMYLENVNHVVDSFKDQLFHLRINLFLE